MTSTIQKKVGLQEIALQYLNDGVFIFDKDRKIILFIPACEQIVGFSREEIRRSDYNCFDIFNCHSSDGTCLAICPGIDLFEEKRTKIAREYHIKTKDGKQKSVSRPQTIDGMDIDEFILKNADPVWLHQNEMWEYMEQNESTLNQDEETIK